MTVATIPDFGNYDMDEDDCNEHNCTSGISIVCGQSNTLDVCKVEKRQKRSSH